MSAKLRHHFFSRAFAAIGAASSAAAAVQGGRAPRARDLQALGIDPASFPQAHRAG